MGPVEVATSVQGRRYRPARKEKAMAEEADRPALQVALNNGGDGQKEQSTLSDGSLKNKK